MRLLAVGRLIELKRIDDTIAAFKLLSETAYKDWSLTIVGDGPERAKLGQLACGDPRICFTGATDYATLGHHFESSDALVIASSSEHWGLVVNEALGYGLYVLASDSVGAAVDLITPQSGFIFRSGDRNSLADAMKRAGKFTERQPRPAAPKTSTLMLEALNEIR